MWFCLLAHAYYVSLRFVVMYTHDGTEIQTHGFAAQSFRFKGGLLNHIVGLSPKEIIENQATFNIHKFTIWC